MFEFAEEALDEVALLVEDRIEGPPRDGAGSARNDGNGSGGGDGIDGTLPVIAFVSEDEAGPDAIEQGFDLSDVVALAACQEDANRQAERVGGDMDLGAQPAFGAAERVSFSPFLGAPALCWWARTIVLSTSTYSQSGVSAKALKRRSQTPSRHQRLNRW